MRQLFILITVQFSESYYRHLVVVTLLRLNSCEHSEETVGEQGKKQEGIAPVLDNVTYGS